jgi:cell division protein FtsW
MLARGPAARSGAPPIEYSLLLTATLCLLALGAVMVFSASSATTLLAEGEGDGAYYLKRVILFAAIGLLVMRIASMRGARLARALTPVLVAVALVLLAAVLMPDVGRSVNGAQRWLGAGLVQFQPSELAKLALVLYGAHMLAVQPRRVRSLSGLAPYLVVVGVALLLIAGQPDLGTAVGLGAAVACLLVAAGTRLRTLLPLAAAMGIAVLAMVAAHPYQQERLTSFLDPAADTGGAGFQATQATIALGSGGVLGVGLGESVQKAFYLPEAHTDMVAAVLGEEAGLAGMAVLIGLFGMFGYAGFRAAHRSRDRYGKLLAAGLTSLVLAQAAINLFAVLGLAPLTGVPLPFVSYGGSSLIVTLASAGLILNVARGPRASAAPARNRARRRPLGAAGSGAKLRVRDGTNPARRRRRGASRDSGGRHRRSRRAGDRSRRRVAR